MAEPVGLQVQVPDGFERLNTLLSIKRQRTALGVEQQQARQKAALAKYDWNKHVGEDGMIDLPSLSADPELAAAAGDQYQDVLAAAALTKDAQVGVQSHMTALRTEQRAALASMLNGLRSDGDVAQDTPQGRQKVTQALIQYGEQYGPDVLPVLTSVAPMIQGVGRGKLNEALRNIGLQAQAVENQSAAQQPSLVDTGAAFQNVNPNAIPSAPIEKTLSPAVGILTDANGVQYRYDQQNNTLAPVGRPAPAGPGAAPGAPTFTQPRYQGQQADVARNQEEVANVRAAADAAPANRNIFQHILELAKDTSTGPLVSFLQDTKIGGQAFGDNYQELGKYLERNAINNMAAMGGPPSDARLSAAVAANGSTKFNPQALRAVTEFNYATNTGLERYRRGVDSAVGTDNPDYTKLPAFKAAWAKNFDIDAFRLENAIADGDAAAQREILDGLSAPRRKDLAAKMKALDALSDTGKLP